MSLPGDLVKAIREELTSGDPNTKKLLTEILLIAILKDSTGSELSDYIKNLDVPLGTRASESTLSAIKSKTDNIDVPLSSRASESTLSAIKSKTDNLDVALSALRDFFRPLVKGSVFNQSVTANTNIFSSDLTPSLATTNNPSYFRIFACFNASGVLSVVKTKGSTTVTMQLNGGGALSANCLYAFDIMVEYGESVNLRYSVNATALDLKVVEIASVV
jgi:hypothetical protein